MAVSSGTRPYEYVGPNPFSGSGINPIGYSGVLFEQVMFALIAERAIYSAQTNPGRVFNKYINKTGSLAPTFEPTPLGINLTGQNPLIPGISGGPACVNFKNYLIDTRTRLSGLFSLIATDSPYTAAEIGLDYFIRYFGDNPSGTVGNWRHATTELAGKGNIYDLDLREVMYQPYIRISKYNPTSFSGLAFPFSPVIPCFFSKTGSMINVSSRDLAHAANLGTNALSGYQAAANGYVLVQGDMFEPTNARFYLWESGQLKSSIPGICASIGTRQLNLNTNRMRGQFTPPSTNVGTGIYSLQVWTNNSIFNGYYTAPSGAIGFWPRLEELVTSGYIRATLSDGSNEKFCSGIHVFNTALWNFGASGSAVISPINGAFLWLRFADQQAWSTTNFGPSRWNGLGGSVATPIVGANDKITIFAGQTQDLDPDIVIADRRFVFARYSPTSLDFVSAGQNSFSYNSATSPPGISAFFFVYGHTPVSGINLSNYYFLSEAGQAVSSGPEYYIVDTDFENRGCYESNGNPYGPCCVVNGNIYGYDPNQVAGGSGTFFWQHFVFDDSATSFPPPVASGGIVEIGNARVYETRETRYTNGVGGIAHLFEPLNPNNFSFAGMPKLVDPRNTDLDYGDGSILVYFTAKMKGETVFKAFEGRMKEGAAGVMNIFEFIPLQTGAGVPAWAYGLS